MNLEKLLIHLNNMKTKVLIIVVAIISFLVYLFFQAKKTAVETSYDSSNVITRQDQYLQEENTSKVDINQEIIKRIQLGQGIIEKNNFQIKNIKDVPEERIDKIFQLDDILFAFVMQSNMNYYFDDIGDPELEFGGVLYSLDGGNVWEKLYIIKDVKEGDRLVRHNPINFFNDDLGLYLDIIDDRGAGSGEGNLVRLFSDDGGKNWNRQDCFSYIPEEYEALNKVNDLSSLSQSSYCIYP